MRTDVFLHKLTVAILGSALVVVLVGLALVAMGKPFHFPWMGVGAAFFTAFAFSGEEREK